MVINPPLLLVFGGAAGMLTQNYDRLSKERVIPAWLPILGAGGLLDGVNAASLGLMAAVTLILGRAALTDIYAVILGVMSTILLFGFKINSTWLVLGGATAGFLRFTLFP
jgi:chromate transporter